jgi:hypothetical protein
MFYERTTTSSRLKLLAPKQSALMNSFSLFEGTRGAIGTVNVTADPRYSFVVQTIDQIRDAVIMEKLLRQPFLDLFIAAYKEDANLPDNLKHEVPREVHITGQVEIKQFGNDPPTDADVLEFFTNAFPDVYLVPGEMGTNGGEYREPDKVYITIARSLVQLWYQTVSTVVVWFTYTELNSITAAQPWSFFRITADIYIHVNVVR